MRALRCSSPLSLARRSASARTSARMASASGGRSRVTPRLIALPDQGGDVLGVGGRAEQGVEDQGPAQEQVGVVLPGEADAPVHLDVHLGVVDGRPEGQRGRHGRREGELVGVVVQRPAPRPTPRRWPARPPPACWRSGA